nr:PREDICTED: sperm acrosome membrane-associated protein 4-like [Paralichthys olivaceus]
MSAIIPVCVWIYIRRHWGPHWFLTSILLATALLLPALSADTLVCHYCPLQHKDKSCGNITSQCLPGQRCSSSTARYGAVHVLSAQGCLDGDLCGSHELMSHRGVKYNVSHSCCCMDECNGPPRSDAGLKRLLGIMKNKAHNGNITDVLRELAWDSCANYTSLRNNIPDTA